MVLSAAVYDHYKRIYHASLKVLFIGIFLRFLRIISISRHPRWWLRRWIRLRSFCNGFATFSLMGACMKELCGMTWLMGKVLMFPTRG
ncbi:hypothetical protein AAC387_Pa02g1881 [Persea americana]